MKKAQVTTFIILGIVILVAIVFVIYLNDYLFKSELQREAESFTVPQQVQPVKNYIDSCVLGVAKQGVELIGFQGGYLTLNNNQQVNPLMPFADTLRIFNDNNLVTSYWFYETDNGIQKNQVPALDDININLENYIKDNVAICFSDLQTTFNDYNINNANDIYVDVDIKEEAVIVKIINNIDIQQQDFNFILNQHFVELDVGLGKTYDIAKKIIEKENQEYFLEDKTEDILILYDEIPYSGIDLDCNIKTWNKYQVYNDLKLLLKENIGSIKLANTNFDSSNGYFIWSNVLDKNYNNINVDFTYLPSWPLKMDVEPSQGNILKGTRINKGGLNAALNLFCLNSYQFIYDIKYPVLVSIFDSNAFNGQGFTFQFGTQVIINNNQPRNDLVNAFNIDKTDKTFCQTRQNQVNLFALDSDVYQISGVEKTLGGVSVSYKCFNQECSIGETALDENNLYSLNEEFPICVNGMIIADKNGYLKKETQFSTDTPSSIVIELNKIYNANLEISIDNSNIADDEEVILNFNTNDYSTSVSYPDTDNLDLISGTYNVTAYLVKKGSFIIKGGTANQCVKIPRASLLGVLGLKKEECFTTNLDDLNLNEVVITNNKFEIFVPISDLQQGKKLIININKGEIPENYQELNQVYEEKEVIGDYQFV